MSILVADDDPQLATFLSKSLESEGYSVRTASDASSLLAELEHQNYKLIILDLNFGQTDGLQLLEKLRAEGLETPVMVLSARNRVSDRIQSLNLGADDYVTKPFSFQELAARANAILRRKTDPSLSVLRVGDLELDPAMRRVFRAKREIRLSPKEFALLQLLMGHAGEAVSRRELHKEAWGTQETDSNLVDVYVNYLRKKVDSSSPEKLIQTVRGAGYRLGPPAPAGATSAAASTLRSRHSFAAQPKDAVDGDAGAEYTLMRGLAHSVAHDIAQPLSSVRGFLEMLASRGSSAVPTADVKTIEQQTDRAIALSKGLSAMVRDVSPPTAPWISLDDLLSEIFETFALVLDSGLLTVDRQWDPSIQVTSNPALSQLLALFVCKLLGRNTRPLALTVSAQAKEGHCDLTLIWRATDQSSTPVLDAANILIKELSSVYEIVYSIDGDMVLTDGRPEITLRLPSAPHRNQQVLQ
jgi:DNA-binding response OmpR family regulator